MDTISLKAQLSKKALHPERTHVLYLLAEVTAAAKGPAGRLPLNVSFVLDRSGSMSGAKLAYTKQAVSYAVNHLLASDFASLVAYDAEVEVLAGAGPVEYRDRLKGAISSLFPGGSTNLSGGLLAGYREVLKNQRDGQVNRVILLTDGLANVGITEPEKLRRKAAEMGESGVAVTTIGVGDDFDEELLTAMAEASRGNYYYIENSDRIPQIFQSEMQSLLSVVAQNAAVKFSLAEGVAVRRVWGYQPSGSQPLAFRLPDLYAGDRKLILMEIEVGPQAAASPCIGSLCCAYDEVETLKYVEAGFDILVDWTRDAALLAAPEAVEVMVQVELQKTAEIRDQAMKLAEAGEREEAARLLAKQQQALLGYAAAAPEADRENVSAECAGLFETAQFLLGAVPLGKLKKHVSFQNYKRRRRD